MKKILVCWRDIPSQVMVQRGRERGKALLSHRFQAAIDRAAMRAGKGGSKEYLEDWRRTSEMIDEAGSPQELADKIAATIEQDFSSADLAMLVKQKGFN
ncbi:MAG: hypothetical protein CMK35_03040 [Porticoccaceae bacterium]|nr:hypothetical protein [Porticoccaceae bacterium]